MNFVLVHGGWHGGWCWRAISDKLTALGHRVLAPTMTGLGERKHLLGSVTGPETHVEDICNVVRYEELDRVILVGHSYGGMVITGAASQITDRIAGLVYLDAFVPTKDGQATNMMANPERAKEIAKAIQPDGTITPNGFERWSSDPDTIAWLKKMCTPHPAACFGKGVALSGAEKAIRNRMFILAEKHKPSNFWQFHDLYKNDPEWQVDAFPCLHDIMIEMPDELAVRLDSFARGIE